jgi:transglutaminase-like putative cysteine protease
MKLSIRHEIRIGLPAGTSRAVMHLLLTPRDGPGQTIRDWTIELPEGAKAVLFSDGFNNRAQLIAQGRPPEEWMVTATGKAETTDRNGVLGRMPGEPVPRLFLRQTPLTAPSPELVKPFEDAASRKDRIGLLHRLMSLTPMIVKGRSPARAAQSQTQAASGERQAQVQTLTPPATAARPSPPDLAHAFIGGARALGIPARYVTGYLGRETAQAPAMHAWAEAYDDNLGWIGFDPQLQLCPTDRHLRVAVGLDATSAAPLRASPAALAVPAPKLTIEMLA